MKIIFKGLGPTGNIVHDGKLIEDGAIIDMEEKMAMAYVESKLAYEVTDETEAIRIQSLIRKNIKTRNEVLKAAGIKDTAAAKKGGKK